MPVGFLPRAIVSINVLLNSRFHYEISVFIHSIKFLISLTTLPLIILDNATNDANQIRVGAIHYTDDLLSQAESAIGRTLDTYTSKYDSLVNSLQECYDMVRNNRAELDVPPETEQNVQQEYPQDQYPAEEYPQDTYEQDTYGQDDYLDDGNSYPDDMPISDYDIQEDDTLD